MFVITKLIEWIEFIDSPINQKAGTRLLKPDLSQLWLERPGYLIIVTVLKALWYEIWNIDRQNLFLPGVRIEKEVNRIYKRVIHGFIK